jgi:hypothetical protein
MIDEKIIEGLREYIKDHYIPAGKIFTSTSNAGVSSSRVLCMMACDVDEVATFRDISDEATEYIKEHRKPGGFAHTLERLRNERELSPAELYKRANIDRRQYSRFMGPEGRHPSMNTVISFALALRLDRAEFDEFLQTAGYSLSKSSTRDVCIMYCLEKRIYDIYEVNALLFAVGIEPLSRE